MKVFISHSSRDKRFVRTLKQDLSENGIGTFVDEDALELGDSLIERLEVAIDEATHFIIVFSPSAMESQWVKMELNQATKLFNEKLLKKIIPIKFKECDLPANLDKLIYGDLTKEIVQVDGDKLKFISEGYTETLLKLVKALRSQENRLSPSDRKELKEDVSKAEEKKMTNNITWSRLKIIKYRDTKSLNFYRNKIAATPRSKNKHEIQPITLPPIFQQIFKGIKIGDKLLFSKDDEMFTANFAGFRASGISMAVPPKIRELMNLQNQQEYDFEITINNRQFRVAV